MTVTDEMIEAGARAHAATLNSQHEDQRDGVAAMRAALTAALKVAPVGVSQATMEWAKSECDRLRAEGHPELSPVVAGDRELVKAEVADAIAEVYNADNPIAEVLERATGAIRPAPSPQERSER